MKTALIYIVFIIIGLDFNNLLYSQNSLKFRILTQAGYLLSNYEVMVDQKLLPLPDPDNKLIFEYGNETQQYKFEIINKGTGLRKRFTLSVDKGKNDFPGTYLVFNRISTFVRLEDENYDLESIFNTLDSCGASDLFIETFYDGKTIYPSTVKGIGQHGNEDFLKKAIIEGKKHSIKIHALLRTLNWFSENSKGKNYIPQNALMINRNGKSNEGDEAGLQFVSPNHPKVVKILNELVEEIITRYPDLYGINFDDLRFKSGIVNKDNLNQIDFGFEESTSKSFKELYKKDPKNIVFDTSENSDWRKWIGYKKDMITNLLVKLVGTVKDKNKNIIITASVFPNYINQKYFDVSCQDWEDFLTFGGFGGMDYLLQICKSPKDYTQELDVIKPYIVNSAPVIALSGSEQHDSLEKQLRILNMNFMFAEFGILHYRDLKIKENQKLLYKIMFR